MTGGPQHVHSAQAGIALMEVLVSLLVLALMAASVTMLLFQMGGLQTRAVTSQEGDEIARYRAVLRDLVSAGLREPGAFGVTGDKREIRVRALTSLGPLPVAQYDITLQRRPQQGVDGPVYVMGLASVDQKDADAVVFERELPRALRIRQITYFGRETGNGQQAEDAVWQEEWSFQNTPDLVRFDFTRDTKGVQSPLIIGR